MRQGLSFFLVLGLMCVSALAAGPLVIGAEEATPCPIATPMTSTPATTATPSMPASTPVGPPCAVGVRKIEVEASAYKFTPNTFDLKVGQPVTFVITSADIFHTFTVAESKDAQNNLFSVDVPAGKTVTYTFTPTKAGDLFLYCIPHRALGMVGSIHVSS